EYSEPYVKKTHVVEKSHKQTTSNTKKEEKKTVEKVVEEDMKKDIDAEDEIKLIAETSTMSKTEKYDSTMKIAKEYPITSQEEADEVFNVILSEFKSGSYNTDYTDDFRMLKNIF